MALTRADIVDALTAERAINMQGAAIITIALC